MITRPSSTESTMRRHTSRSDNSLLPGVKRVGLVHPPTKQIFSIFWGCSLYNMRKGFSRTNTLCWLACFLLPAFPEHVQHCAPCTLQRDLSRCQCGGKFLNVRSCCYEFQCAQLFCLHGQHYRAYQLPPASVAVGPRRARIRASCLDGPRRPVGSREFASCGALVVAGTLCATLPKFPCWLLITTSPCLWYL